MVEPTHRRGRVDLHRRMTDVSSIPGVLLHPIRTFEDERGFFREIIRESALGDAFVQSNHSHSQRGVLRGLHYHRHQADAWYVISGRAQAVMVDLRTQRPDPAVISVELSPDDPCILYIPPGVAHGYLALTELDLIYWVSSYYDPDDENGVAWDDPTIAAPWELSDPILSDRDKNNPPLDWQTISLS